MASTHLTLFPKPSTGLPRRTTSLLKLQTSTVPNNDGEIHLDGVAFKVLSPSKPQRKIQPATETIQHSLFCDPAATAAGSPATITSNSSARRREPLRTRRRSNPVPPQPNAVSSIFDDHLSELPLNTQFGSGSPSKRSLNLQTARPLPISIMPDHELVTPVEERQDAVSPLPTKTAFSQPTPTKPEFPGSTGHQSPMRSMFPQYDHTRPWHRQSYYPTPQAVSPPSYSSPTSSTIAKPIQHKQELKRYDSAVGLIDGYEHIPAAGHADLEALWKASVESFPCDGRKVQFLLFQPGTSGTSLGIGTSPADLIYLMQDDHAHGDTPKQYSVRKHCPTAPSSSPVSQLVLPERGVQSGKDSLEITTIFPHSAAMASIEAIANSPKAAVIATFDPSAESPAAQTLARDAVVLAHERHACDLVKRARHRDAYASTVTASYDLQHPSLGIFPITVTKSTSRTHAGPRAKISLHHPSATPAAVAADTLNLAFLDFARDACVLDLPGLLALDSRFVLDTVVSTLLAVAAIENEALVREQMTFAPPPRLPIQGSSSASVSASPRPSFANDVAARRRPSVGSGKSKLSYLARRRERKEVREIATLREAEVEAEVRAEEVEKLPSFGRAVVGLVGLSIKGSWWVAKTGVKVGVKGVKIMRS